MRTHEKFSCLLLIIGIILSANLYQAFSQQDIKAGKNIMLILGSADLATTKERVEVGHKLFKSSIDFDYIIVSGGCGAHGSGICEASEMTSMLIEKGVPKKIIYKEEKSASTVQNYCFSRILQKEDGSRLMNPNDNLYVVSNHWHAIPVAARYSTYDKLNATYHIEGSIKPTAMDKVDYTSIYNHKLEGEDFCESALWPQVHASYSMHREEVHLVLDKHFYHKSPTGYDKVLKERNENIINFTAFPADWEGIIDAAFFDRENNEIYFFKGSEMLRYSSNGNERDREYRGLIKNWMKKIPQDWEDSYIDAAFFNPLNRKVYIFKGQHYVEGSLKNGELWNGKPHKISDFITNWPFKWGGGDIDAAHYDEHEEKLFFFRGREFISISLESKEADFDFPKNTELLITKP